MLNSQFVPLIYSDGCVEVEASLRLLSAAALASGRRRPPSAGSAANGVGFGFFLEAGCGGMVFNLLGYK